MTKKKLTNKESEQAAKALQALFASEYVNKKKLYTQNFIRGISFGAGSFLGATIGAAVIIFVLSLFSQVPLLGRLTEGIEQTINSSK